MPTTKQYRGVDDPTVAARDFGTLSGRSNAKRHDEDNKENCPSELQAVQEL